MKNMNFLNKRIEKYAALGVYYEYSWYIAKENRYDF